MLETLSVSPLMGYVSYLCCVRDGFVFKSNSLLVDFVFDDVDKVCVIVYCALVSHSKHFSLVQASLVCVAARFFGTSSIWGLVEPQSTF